MNTNPDNPIQDERRERERFDKHMPVQLTIDTSSLKGTTENISEVGILFFTEESLRVSIEVEEGGVRMVRKGRLVRVQRMSLENTGYAVEFDHE